MKNTLKITLLLGTLALTSQTLAAPLEIGRLFLSPQERATLDRGGRLYRATRDTPAPAAASDANAPVAPQNIQLDGYVVRPGNDTVWLNGESIRAGGTNSQGISPQTSQKLPHVPIKLKDGRIVTLKVGEVFNPNTGTVERIDVKKQ